MRFRRLHFHRLNKEEQERWKDKIFDLADDVVPNIKREQFDAFFFSDQLTTAKYFVIMDGEKKLLAFYCGYYQIVQILGRANYVYNSRIIVSPEYQGRALLVKTFIAQFRAFGFVALKKGGYWVSNTVNPISYHGVVNTCWQSYPRFDTPLTPEMIQIVECVAEINHFKLAQAKDIIKTTSGLPPKYSEEQLERMYKSSKPHIRFFIEQEVDFLKGEGIPVVVPYTFKNISLTVWRAFRRSTGLIKKK